MQPIFLIVILLFHCTAMLAVPKPATRETEIISTFQKKEIIEGITFLFKEEIINGICQKTWTVNGTPVDETLFQTTIADAEKELIKKQRALAEQHRSKEQATRHESMNTAHKKMLSLAIEETEQWIQKLYAHNLMPFLAFDTDTIQSQELFEQITHLLLPSAKKLVTTQNANINDIHHALHTHFEDLPQRLSHLFYASVHRAIDQCNDTKTLKGLLDIVAVT